MAQDILRRNYEELGMPVGPYTHCVAYNGVLYLSGFTAYGTEHQHGSLAEQAGAILDQIALIAKKEGSGLHRLLSVVIYVTDLEELAGLREVLFERYRTAIPASTLVHVAGLFAPELKIEITAQLAAS